MGAAASDKRKSADCSRCEVCDGTVTAVTDCGWTGVKPSGMTFCERGFTGFGIGLEGARG
jgi:hypothetical protein